MIENKELESMLVGLQSEVFSVLNNPEVLKGIMTYIFNMKMLHGISPDISIQALLTVGARHEEELITVAKKLVKNDT